MPKKYHNICCMNTWKCFEENGNWLHLHILLAWLSTEVLKLGKRDDLSMPNVYFLSIFVDWKKNTKEIWDAVKMQMLLPLVLLLLDYSNKTDSHTDWLSIRYLRTYTMACANGFSQLSINHFYFFFCLYLLLMFFPSSHFTYLNNMNVKFYFNYSYCCHYFL